MEVIYLTPHVNALVGEHSFGVDEDETIEQVWLFNLVFYANVFTEYVVVFEVI